ncbi:MAG: secondary thiamine-phosphate synthase enzyme YjbQ [Candidatus Aenigmarchaeota archaeon]|nr:secondary thiamine-phosphate synthase enzyme YjbQ [Candidatus Aenigmarchaeota archaeon]
MIYRDIIKITTKTDGFHDLTKQVGEIVGKSGAKDGLCNIFLQGTTASLAINENDRMLIEDFKKTLTALIPDDHLYQHSENAPSHLRAAMLNQNLTIPISKGKLMLGKWQSVLLFEFDTQDREREIVVTVQGV